MPPLTIVAAIGCLVAGAAFSAPPLANPGFEEGAAGWSAFEQGFDVVADTVRSGQRAIRCVNDALGEKRGALAVLQLDQREPAPVLLTGWSRADRVDGVPDSDYALYVDVEYADGTNLWGQAGAFSTGTHDWERRQVRIIPAKPIRRLRVYALLRRHVGTAWFDDFTATQLSDDRVFDSQPLAPPTLRTGKIDGWFVRDVAADGPIVALPAPGLRLSLAGGTARLSATDGRARAVTLYYVRRVAIENGRWWQDIRRSLPPSHAERTNSVRVSGYGATETIARYPFACVTGEKAGAALAIPPDQGPRVARLGWHGGTKLLYAAFDLALTPTRPAADVRILHYPVDPIWGFRDAAARYYRRFPAHFDRRARAEGIWIPFTDPALIQGADDFGIAYHEGDNAVASDDRKGILSFRYAEPMSYWMPQPVGEPRTYEAAHARLERLATSGSDEEKRWAEATLATAATGLDGRLQHEFRNEPWANGTVWALNPNPRLAPGPTGWTKARLNFDVVDADQRYGAQTGGVLDGEYLDSIEGWADTLDVAPRALAASLAPPTFSSDTFRPVVPLWFGVWEFTDFLRTDLRRRGKLLMANATPWRFWGFSPLVDVSGTETNWNVDNVWRPDDDATFCLRRTLAFQKPYLLLQNTEFSRFGVDKVAKYFARSLAYGVYPSFFSLDASTNPYWLNPAWYNRDRALFKKYIPVIRELAKAGWEPITHARTNRPTLYVERFGKNRFTLFNDSGAATTATLSIDLKALGLPARVRVVDRLTGKAFSATAAGGTIRVPVSLASEAALALEIGTR